MFQTNVLTELRKWKLTFIEHHELEVRQEREKHAAHVRQLNNQMDNLRELLHTYEISVGRKDEVIVFLYYHSSIRNSAPHLLPSTQPCLYFRCRNPYHSSKASK